MSNTYNDMDEHPKRRQSLCSCLGHFVIWLFPVSLALGVALFFSPNERVKDIETYNTRANEWMKSGFDDFRNATFTVCLNKDCVPATFSQHSSGELYPTGDKCDKEGDPKEGCVETVPGFFEREVEKITEDVVLSIVTENSIVVVNETIRASQTSAHLKSVCYRVRETDSGYELDIPPTWELRTNPVQPGCEFGNGWDPVEYTKKPVDKISIQIRSYQDPYIAASSLTRGCNEEEKNSGCFGITSTDMKTYGLYAMVVTGAVTLVELLILLSACCCCRQKIPCCNKEYDELN